LQCLWWYFYCLPSWDESLGCDQTDGPGQAAEKGSFHKRDPRNASFTPCHYIESFLYKNELWVVMDYMEGDSLKDVVTEDLITEGQIAAVSRETAQGLQHLHKHSVIHRDIKSDNVLLSLTGDIKLSTYHDFPEI
jgi:serine/threonine protein kinase